MRLSSARTISRAAGTVGVALTFLAAWGGSAGAENAISRQIERAHPCGGVKTKVLGATVGIDQFKGAEVESLKVKVDHDDAKVQLVGSLTCRTSDAAVVRGDASARFGADAELDLKNCAVSRNSVHIISTGGTFASAVDVMKGTIEKAVEGGIADQAKALCR